MLLSRVLAAAVVSIAMPRVDSIDPRLFFRIHLVIFVVDSVDLVHPIESVRVYGAR